MAEPKLVGRFIFVSHSSRDTWVAKRIAEAIMVAGATAFLDEADIEVGDDFEEQIRSFLERADELVVLLTPWALDRPWVWSEVGAAWIRRIPIITILHGISASELQTRPEVPIFLKQRDLIDLNNIDLYFAELKLRVERAQSEKETP